MTERKTIKKLAKALEGVARYLTEAEPSETFDHTCYEAAARLRELDGEPIVSYPDNITTLWLEMISDVKHSARAKGETSPIHNLTSVESILKWWEEEIRPTIVLQLREPNKPQEAT
ncbi:hypothetical protein LCGC14_2676710 [marine sediment metagenome]|uniref:Uncharacterized protein n=1 Tax=marine sediment metagenome TaxID=412755 RepID=A0A0F9AA33_9ZZZZ